MPAISVGSVEVDVIPSAQGVRQRMQNQLVPAANQVGDEVGRIIGRYLTSHVANAFVQGINRGGRNAQPAAARQGQSTGSTFGRSFKATLEAALAALPEVRLRANSTDAEREIYQIRAQMRALSDARIGIDVSTATANAAIGQLQARLARLSASDADVAVRVDAGAAAAQLASFQAQVNRLDGQTANVNVDTRSATANLHLLATAAVAFGPAILPVLPVVAAGLGAIAAAAAAAAVGIGAIGLVAIPAFKGIGSALQAQKAAQDAATNATYQGAQASGQGASQALQQASAAQALATAERNGARQIAQAQQQVKQAKQQAADAVAQAAVRNEQAARRVQDAERSLADAQRDAKRAQTDLSDARREAAQELQDLNSQLAGSRLDQRQAVLDLQDAERELRAVQAKGSAATAGELQRAQLNYDRAKQNLADQKTETQRLGQETEAANKAGVEGSDTFKSAQERLVEAQQKVADQAQAVKDAQQEAARTQLETARQVADAQQRVGEATSNVAVAQQNAADAVASAQRQIESASISAAGGIDQAAIAQAKYEAELAKLTPAARDTMDAYLGLRDAFSAWSKSLQPAVMPIFTRALNAMARALPGLTPFVKAAADAIQVLMDRASADLKTPFWRGFKEDLEGSVKPAVIGLGVAFGNVFKGMAGIIGAFLPHMDSISQRMQDVTGRFAGWGASLKGSPEFQKFLSYSAEMGPKIADALGSIVGAAISVASAMAPITKISLGLITGLADGIGWVADNAPWVITGIYGIVTAMYAWRLVMLLWTGVMWLASAAMAAFNLISKFGPWGWIVLAITGVVTALYFLWTRCEWFREAVLVVWDGIKAGGQAVVDWFSGPFVRFFTETIPAAFRATLDWVKRNWPWIVGALGGPVGLGVVYVLKHWDDIQAGLASGWSWIKRTVLSPIRDFFTKTVPGWAGILKDKVVEAWDAARAGIKTAWDKVKGIAREPIQYVIDVVYNNGLRGVWNKVAGAFGAEKLPYFKFASGGVMPGYTPGRDVHRFVSPTGGALELSGGEAIMRPEFTRAVGSGFVSTMNAIASSRGAQGVKAALAPVFGGNPATSTDRSLRYRGGGVVQSFADGGIFGWIGSAANKVAGAGSAAWNKIKDGASWLADTLEASARAGVKHVVDPLLKRFPGMDTGFGRMIRGIPTKIIDTLFGYAKKADDKGAGGIGGPKIQAALKWAKTQNGLPYQWGGNGNPSWDCSGFMSAIESVIRGQNPHRRWSTHAFSGRTAPPGWVYHGSSPFKVGITAAGVGHTAGTLGKTKVESRGGDGVVVGNRARGYNDRLFTSWYGFKPGSYDSGGYLQPGLNLAYNGTGRPEPVFTTSQANALSSMASRGVSGPMSFEGDLRLDSGEFLGRVRGEATAVMQAGQQQLIQTLNAS
jgi:phage-related protein